MGAPEAFSGRSTTVPSVRKRLGKAVLCLLSLVLVLAPLAPAYAVDERPIDVVSVTWFGASAPKVSVLDIQNAIQVKFRHNGKE